jgi:hypothetical protein
MQANAGVGEFPVVSPRERSLHFARDGEPMNEIEVGLISLDSPRPHHDEFGSRCARLRRRGSRVIEWGLVVALAGVVGVAASITTTRVRPQPDDPPRAPIDSTGQDTRGIPPMIVTHRQAVAGEQITVLVAGAALGTRREGMCGPLDLRFDGRPALHVVRFVRWDPSHPDVTSTAVMIVPADAATGEHEIGLYAPVPSVRAGAVCAEEPGRQASIAVASIIVVAAGSGPPERLPRSVEAGRG